LFPTELKGSVINMNKGVEKPKFYSRLFQEDDKAASMNLHELSLPIKYPSSFYDSLLKPGRCSVLLFDESSHHLLGCATGSVKRAKSLCFSLCSSSQSCAMSGYVMTICCDPKYRRQGFGKELLRRLTLELARHGVEKIVLHVQTQNAVAIKLYKGFGYYISKFCGDYYYYHNDYHDAYEMTFDIPMSDLGDLIVLTEENLDRYLVRSTKKDATQDFTLIARNSSRLSAYFVPIAMLVFLLLLLVFKPYGRK
jgi:GNAT superfamily N-acetyltransferase